MQYKKDWKDTFDKKVLPPKGMRDFTPEEKKLRQDMVNIIRKEYRKNGFSEIETSFIESIERLENSDGGENTELLFKLLRNTDNLDLDSAELSDLSNLGLRFDLTLPLCRFYSRYKTVLPKTFKSIQIGNVFRAEKPRPGRYNSFVQCDIDIIGDPTNTAEIELINTVSRVFLKLDIKGFTIKINDRRIIHGLAEYSGFSKDSVMDVILTLDKLDKIDTIGVINELLEKGYEKKHVETFIETLEILEKDGLKKVQELDLSPDGYKNIEEILSILGNLSDDFEIVYDPTVARGMGYYTSTVFEITYKGVGNSLAGGGRYDTLIEKVSDIDVPACGFSIGFERVADLLKSQERSLTKERKLAVLIACMENRKTLLEDVNLLKENYDVVSIYTQEEFLDNQLKDLKEQGFNYYTSYCDMIKIKPID